MGSPGEYVDYAASKGAIDTLTIGLAAVPESVKQAREFARMTLGGWNLSMMYDDVRLVVSELVTNAVRFAGNPGQRQWNSGRADASPISLSLRHFREHLLIEVCDTDDTPPGVHSRGLGLMLSSTVA